MFNRPQSGERAILIHLDLGGHSPDSEALSELKELAASAGAQVLETITGARRAPDPKLFLGKGKAETIKERIQALGAELVLVNHDLSPSQERNLERLFECRVLDRTGLILDIFAQRAQSHEGKLQVELAQLRHMATRLVRGWTHLERQKGGIGLRGPGESQLETDRRLIRHRIRSLNARLDKVRRQREQGRSRRQRNNIPTVSLVGYTNAGKSTLFNALTDAGVYQADKLFATLDPILRQLVLPDGPPAVLADTVGFIRQLPHDLVAAFHSTLQETRDADLLLHVVDVTSEERTIRETTVNDVLAEINARHVPQLVVYNKIDCTDISPRIEDDETGKPVRAWVSATSGVGLDLLRDAISRRLTGNRVEGWLELAPAQGRVRAQLFQLGAVQQEEDVQAGGWRLHVRLPSRDYHQLCAREGMSPRNLQA